MQTIRSKDQYGNVWTAKYNESFSGHVLIRKQDVNSEHLDVSIDFCIIKELAASIILANKMTKLESMTLDQLLEFSG